MFVPNDVETIAGMLTVYEARDLTVQCRQACRGRHTAARRDDRVRRATVDTGERHGRVWVRARP